MTIAILISSSPTSTFARSRTPVELSSPPPSPANVIGNQIPGQYKTSQTTRYGDSTNLTIAKKVLGTRSSAENVPVISHSPSKFEHPHVNPAKFNERPSYSSTVAEPRTLPKPSADWDEVPDYSSTVVRIRPSDVKKKNRADNVGRLQPKKAIARKKDWTPTKPTMTAVDDTPDQTKLGFGMNLAESFGHSQEFTSFEKTPDAGGGALTKRRKVDLTGTGNEAPVLKPKPVAKTTKPRSKSPAKKGLTITGLATSHYFGEEEGKGDVTLMKQFLVSTQARRDEDQDPGTFETTVNKKAPSKKKPKSRLRSPETVLKTLDSQEVVFATLSQCARGESPTLIRDTNEAMMQSMDQLSSSPLPTQRTSIYSVEPTAPQKAGISRFRSRKSLWTAADRDANDALLHVADPFDVLEVRDAFAGEDTLFEHSALIPALDGPRDSLGLLATLKPEEADTSQTEATTFDIDDVTTPLTTSTRPAATVQCRPYTTSARSPSPSKRRKEPDKLPPHESIPVSLARRQPPAKPNYALWPDEQLTKQVKAYGFKRIRARKTMIAKLDEVWAEQHGLNPAKVKAATKAVSRTNKVLQGGDILGTVHALAARPVPKVTKPKAKSVKDDGPEGQPKPKRKGKTSEGQVAKESMQHVAADISDIDNSTTSDRLAQPNTCTDDDLDYFEPSTAPIRGTGVKATTKKKQPPSTPPPTIPPKSTQDTSPGFASPYQRRPASPVAVTTDSSITSSQIEDFPIQSQIRKAIKHPPADDSTRNHQKNPTWHEKMLMYDPIVFEDFTAWLNTEGFNAIGEDREIDVMQVKEWCHENGICCLWRGGWRGNKKKAKGEE